MTCDSKVCADAVKAIVQKSMPKATAAQLKEHCASVFAEHEINLGRVHDTFNHFVYHYNVGSHSLSTTVTELHRMMNLRFRDNAPRRPPRVIIIGPPGSGRSTTAEMVSKRYGLVNVSPLQLMQAEGKINPSVKQEMLSCIEKGLDFPEATLKRLIDKRLGQSDCRVNGWVLDGFP